MRRAPGSREDSLLKMGILCGSGFRMLVNTQGEFHEQSERICGRTSASSFPALHEGNGHSEGPAWRKIAGTRAIRRR